MPAAGRQSMRGMIPKAQPWFLLKVQLKPGWGLEWTSLIGKRAISCSEPRSLSENPIRYEALLLYAMDFLVESYVRSTLCTFSTLSARGPTL